MALKKYLGALPLVALMVLLTPTARGQGQSPPFMRGEVGVPAYSAAEDALYFPIMRPHLDKSGLVRVNLAGGNVRVLPSQCGILYMRAAVLDQGKLLAASGIRVSESRRTSSERHERQSS